MTEKKKPQQVDGPEGSEPAEPAGVKNFDPKPQHVDGPEGPEPPEPQGRLNWDPKPQQVDGPEGPEPTDGTELIELATGQKPKPKGKK